MESETNPPGEARNAGNAKEPRDAAHSGSGRGMSEVTWEILLSEQIRQNGRLFYQLAYRILRDGGAAEDVCQQAFLRAWEEREKIDGGGQALKSWLARTVVNG